MTVAITSDTEIVNQALARLGEEGIFSIEDENKRARTSKRLYFHSLNYVLAYNWPFARRIKSLNELSGVPDEEKLYSFVHQAPSGYHHIIDLLPLGRRGTWDQIGNQIHSKHQTAVALYITRNISAINFSAPFVNSVVTFLASLLSGPITTNDEKGQSLMQEFATRLPENLRMDANIGSQHFHPDMDPDSDPFVTGDKRGFPFDEEEEQLLSRYLLP